HCSCIPNLCSHTQNHWFCVLKHRFCIPDHCSCTQNHWFCVPNPQFYILQSQSHRASRSTSLPCATGPPSLDLLSLIVHEPGVEPPVHHLQSLFALDQVPDHTPPVVIERPVHLTVLEQLVPDRFDPLGRHGAIGVGLRGAELHDAQAD